MRKKIKEAIKSKKPLPAERNQLRRITLNLDEVPAVQPNRLFVSDNLKRLAGEVANAWSKVDEALLEQFQPTSAILTFASNAEAQVKSKTLKSIYQEMKNTHAGLQPIKVVNRSIKVGIDFFIPNFFSDVINQVQETNSVELDQADLGANITKPYLEFFQGDPTITVEFPLESESTKGASELISSLMTCHEAFISFLQEMGLVTNRTHHLIEVREDNLIIDGQKRSDISKKTRRGILILALFRYQTWFKTEEFCGYYNGPENKDTAKVFHAVMNSVKAIIPKLTYETGPNGRSINGVRFRVIGNEAEIKEYLTFQAKVR